MESERESIEIVKRIINDLMKEYGVVYYGQLIMRIRREAKNNPELYEWAFDENDEIRQRRILKLLQDMGYMSVRRKYGVKAFKRNKNN